MNREKRQIARWLRICIGVLIVSGISAIPLEKELGFVIQHLPFDGSVRGWLLRAMTAIRQTRETYPFLFYGYDWLAFALFMLAILFIGPLNDPVKNRWVIEFGVIACILIIPFAPIAGHFRGIPVWWRLIDCLFGVLGLVPLLICLQKIRILEKAEELKSEQKKQFDLMLV
jgi:hypothetical protein